jgi:hypothetical protein
MVGTLRFAHPTVLFASDTASRSRGTLCPGCARKRRAFRKEGARECRVLGAPAASCAYGELRSTRVFTASSPERPGTPARNGLRLIPRSPRRSGFLASVAGGVNSANLTPASRRQDHTTSPSAGRALVRSAPRVHRIPRSTSVTIAIRPSSEAGQRIYAGDLGRTETGIFLPTGLDR